MSRSGLWAQLGIATESTYGTFVAPTTFLPFNTETFSLDRRYLESQALRAGRMFQAGSLSKPTTRSVTGTFSTELLNMGLGKLLNTMHGNTVTPAEQGSSSGAYEATHNIGTTSPFGKSVSIQVGRPRTYETPTVTPFSYTGCKVTGLSISAAVDQLATAEWTIDGQNEATDESLGSATYPSGIEPFTFVEGSISRESVTLGKVMSVTANIATTQATERFHIGNSTGTKAEPIPNGYVEATASLTAEFYDLTLYNDYLNGGEVEIVLLFEGSEIAGGFNETFEVTYSAAQGRGTTPNVNGPDLVQIATEFKALDDGTNPPVKIRTISTDSAL